MIIAVSALARLARQGQVACAVRLLLVLAITASSLHAAAPSATPASAPAAPLPAKAQTLVDGLRAFRAGVDREGNLWAWNWSSGRVDLYSPAGDRLATANVGPALDVDADVSFGVAAIFGNGREVHLVPWHGQTTSFPLENSAHRITWVARGAVAVAPETTAYRAELWNTRARALVKTFGTERALTPKIGATRLRAVVLDYADRQNLLYSLESFTGELQVFAMDGRLVRRETISRVGGAYLDDAIVRMDQEAREKHEVQTPSLWWFSLAIDAKGDVWVIQSCDKTHGKTSTLRIPLAGSTGSVDFTGACCSRSSTVWNGWLVSYAEPGDPPGACGAWRIP